MVDMQLTNAKLVQRGARMVAEATGLGLAESEVLLTRTAASELPSTHINKAMHALEPYYAWRNHYIASNDLRSVLRPRVQ